MGSLQRLNPVGFSLLTETRSRTNRFANRLVVQRTAILAQIAFRVVARILDWVPLTRLGFLVSGMLIGAIRWFENRNDHVVLNGGTAGLMITAACAASVVLASLWLRFRPISKCHDPIEIIAETPFRTGFRLNSICWLPLVKLELTWERPADVIVTIVAEKKGLFEYVTPQSRGTSDVLTRRFIVSDVFGLSRCIVRRSSMQSVSIKPAIGRASRIPFAEHAACGEQLPDASGRPNGDLIETRRYSPGDPLKLVLWKVYSRTGQLLVRSPERTKAPSRRILAYFVAGAGDESTAGAARAMIEEGTLGDNFLFSADGSPAVVTTASEAVHQVIRSKSIREQNSRSLGEFLSNGFHRGGNLCVLFVPSRSGAWLDNLGRELAAYEGTIHAVIGTNGQGAATTIPVNRLQRLLFTNPNFKTTSDDVSAVRNRLADLGLRVTVVDRQSGAVT